MADGGEDHKSTRDKTTASGGPDAGQAPSLFHLSDAQVSSLAQSAKLETTLFDLAKQSLSERSHLSGESADKNHVYGELNRIMSLNNYQPANLDGKINISDKDLPKGWNAVHAHQQFKLYDSGSTDQSAQSGDALRTKLKEQIKYETSTVPVQPGEGYYQVWARMHPEKSAEVINQEAHHIKSINGNRDVLRVGERLATATEAEREAELQRRLGQSKLAEPEPARTKPPEPKPDDHKPDVHAPVVRPPDAHPPDVRSQTHLPEKPPKPVDAAPDLNGAYLALLNQHNLAARDLHNSENGQGIIGKAFDGAKNTIGISGEGKAWYDPRRAWSGLFDSDLGSKSSEQHMQVERDKLNQLKLAVDSKDVNKFSSIYKVLTGHDYDPLDKGPVSGLSHGAQAAKLFDQSQHNGVDVITDIGVAVAVAASLRAGKGNVAETMIKAMGTGAVVGGISKAGMMQIDGHYANLRHDLSVGALMGATVPIGELGGAQVSRLVGGRMGLSVTGDLLSAKIETQGTTLGTKLISAAAKSGTSGAIFGAVESPGRLAINDYEQGRQIKVSDLALASVTGSALGFVGGTVLGASVDGITNGFKRSHPGAITSVPTKINGVEVPSSGSVGLDQAAKILKMEPADFVKTATDKPYEAVAKAVKLYEDTGLNISKAEPLAGGTALPETFQEALTTVQNVDLLTAESSAKLATKVRVVEKTDLFLQQNPAAIDDPLTRITAETHYQEVVRLKTAQEGLPAADAFEKNFRQDFKQDLKTSMSVEQINNGAAKPEVALKASQPEVEAAYKQKAADYFKDMTDPAQRQRLNELVEDIYTKFNPESLTKTDFGTILDAVPAGDRELAVALLHESAGTSSDTMLRARFQALKGEITDQLGTASPDNVYTIRPDSSANLLGYLYRKSNSISMGMRNIDNLASSVESGHPPNTVVLFDDLSSTPLTQATKDLLSKIPKVYVVDVGAFEKAVNIIDLSEGPQAVGQKLDGLLAQARTIRAANPGMLASGVARETMQSGVDAAAKAIGNNVKIIRPSTNLSIPNATAADDLAKMSDIDALDAQYNIPKASRAQIAKFLSGYVGEERELAARMLAEGAVHNSFPAMVKMAVDLHGRLTDALSQNGMRMNDLLVVSDKDPGGSTHLVSYLFGKANGMSSENFISTKRLNQMIASGSVKDKALAYFDDTIYSGSQVSSMLDNNVSSLMPFKKVVIASLGAYDKGIQSIKGTHLASLGKVEVANAGVHQPFYSNAHPFYSQLGSAQRSVVKNIGGSEGFGNVQGSLIWSYMYPDNNLSFFGNKFSGSVLRLPGS